MRNLEAKVPAHRWPEVLPGGKAVLFTTLRGGEFDIEVLWLATGERRLLIEDASQPVYASSGHLVYAKMPSRNEGGVLGNLRAVPFDAERAEVTGSPVPILENVLVWPGGGANYVLSRNGTLAYRTGDTGTSFPKQLVWVDREGKEKLLPEPPRDISIPRISPDGDRVALNIVENSNIDVWVYDLGRGTFTRLTFDPDWELNPTWSPDGDTIAFALYSPKEIRVISADGSSPSEKMASSEFIATLSSWSPGEISVSLVSRPTGTG